MSTVDRLEGPPAPAQVDRIPSGTRDVLPDEMREIRSLTDRMHAVFEQAGYGEVYTPALEYERTFARQTLDQAAPGEPISSTPACRNSRDWPRCGRTPR